MLDCSAPHRWSDIVASHRTSCVAFVRAAANARSGFRQSHREMRASTCPQCVGVASFRAQTAGIPVTLLSRSVSPQHLSRSHPVSWLLAPCVGVLLFCAALPAQEREPLHSRDATQGAAVEASMSASSHASAVALSASVGATDGESSHADAKRLSTGIPEALSSPEPGMLLAVGALFCWLAFARRRSAHVPR